MKELLDIACLFFNSYSRRKANPEAQRLEQSQEQQQLRRQRQALRDQEGGTSASLFSDDVLKLQL